MSHSWSASLDGTGPFDTTEQNTSKATRDAFIAAMHGAITAEDDAVWNVLMSSLNTLINAMDPSGTATVKARVNASGLHSGYVQATAGFSLTIEQAGAADTVRHNWQTVVAARLTAPEILLARNLMTAYLLSMGQTTSAQDTAAFDALVSAGQAIIAVIDAGQTGAVRVDFSGSIPVGSLNKLSLSLNVSSTQPGAGTAGDPNVSVVRKTAAQQSTVVTLANITDLGVTLSPNSEYRFDYAIVYRSAATTTGIGLAMAGPAGATIHYDADICGLAVDGAAANWRGAGTAFADTILSTGVVAATTDFVAKITGVIRTGASGGTLIPQVRSEVAGSAVTVQIGSHGVIRKIL